MYLLGLHRVIDRVYVLRLHVLLHEYLLNIPESLNNVTVHMFLYNVLDDEVHVLVEVLFLVSLSNLVVVDEQVHGLLYIIVVAGDDEEHVLIKHLN